MPPTTRTIVGPGSHIKFVYKNWHDTTHEYDIEVECLEWMGMEGHQPNTLAPETMVLHGYVFKRDGDERPEMGKLRRRSFRVDGLIEVRRSD